MTEPTPTLRLRTRQHEDRWSAFGASSGLRKISDRLMPAELKKIPIFAEFKDSFLNEISPDIAVAEWEDGATLFEEGSYLDLAFYIVEGEVDLFLQKHADAAQPIFDAALRTPRPGRGDRKGPHSGTGPVALADHSKEDPARPVTFLATLDADLAEEERLTLGPGEVFGEIGALNGWPQSVTARTTSVCKVVQIRLPALRKIKRKSKKLKAHIDETYRDRALLRHLKTTPLLQGVDDNVLEALTAEVELVSYDPDEWVTRAGEPADALYLVRSGFLQVKQALGDGEVVVTYLSKGMTLGEVELMIDGLDHWQYSIFAVGHCELVRIPADRFHAVVQSAPAVERRLWEAAVMRVKEAGHTRQSPARSKLTEFALAKGMVQGNSMLVIDLDVCTRCDDCVRGCASTHGGQPRFVREGEKHNGFLVTRSCYHCEDPVCLVGCPTGAIRRAGVAEVVEVNENLCIGCGTCAGNCPYDAIVMHDTGHVWPEETLPVRLAGEPRLAASKCDLCYTSSYGPACVSSCPHSCASRIGTLRSPRLAKESPEGRDGDRRRRGARGRSASSARSRRGGELMQREAIGGKGRTGVWAWIDTWVQSPGWALGFVATVLLCGVVYTISVTLGHSRASSAWGLGYGYSAVGVLTGVMLYSGRRRALGVRALGPSWIYLQAHVYGGAVFLLLVGMHTAFLVPNGVLTTTLWLLSFWVVGTGVLGILLQKWIPTVLSQGLSVEVHLSRIPELVEEACRRADKLAQDSSEPVRDFYLRSVAPDMQAPQPRWMYYVDAPGDTHAKAEEFTFLRTVVTGEDRARLDELEELYRTKLEMDAHLTLQRALRWWLHGHVPAAVLLVALVVLHVVFVYVY